MMPSAMFHGIPALLAQTLSPSSPTPLSAMQVLSVCNCRSFCLQQAAAAPQKCLLVLRVAIEQEMLNHIVFSTSLL